ncbi:dihydrolipoyl dehydrogenase [Miltoncostaea oceani]|jgi:dihydrolipoamide dehydrogenase|uniref:dihydrolipoyl dehydrogenase n=1 Tax=Miltoncostaea oceani TaxID=2843216 RepID=UPI001C3D8A72|nr:dihydrolipoyl dehydrogenase [Miltoncostaea oceani]
MSEPSRVVVLGGGPAGDVAALRAAQLGATVTMIERAELGGTCLNWGCIPTKALLATADLLRRVRRADEYGLVVPEVSFDFPKMMERKEGIVLKMRQGVEGAAKRKGVNVVRGEGRVDGDAVVVDGERHEYDHLVVCVGTEPSGLPGYDMDHPAVLTSNDILRLETVPESMIVVGGGVIGCEFASLFAALGTDITIVEILPRLLAGIDNRTASQFQKLLEKDGVTVHLGRQAEVTGYRDDGVTVTLDDGTEVTAEKLLVSVGRRSQAAGIGLEEAGVEVTERGHVVVDEYLRTANPKIWAVGDCIGGLQLAHLASAEGGRAVENALTGTQVPMDRTVVPSCIYTHPEIASVGLNADAAKEAGHEVKLGQARFVGSGKALGEGEPDGYAQLVMDTSTGLLLGATIMGVHAVEMIHEVGVAIAEGLTVAELGEIIHAHPTVSEMVMDAAQQAVGVAPYLS